MLLKNEKFYFLILIELVNEFLMNNINEAMIATNNPMNRPTITITKRLPVIKSTTLVITTSKTSNRSLIVVDKSVKFAIVQLVYN